MVDRLLPVAAHEDLSKFGNIFFSDTRKRLTDSHLWISVFARPNKSSYSRVQRLSCLFSLLMMSMLASAMFYQADGTVKVAQGYRLGPFKFTTHEMYISVITSIVVLPINILIDQLFRRSRPRKVINDQAFANERPVSTLSKFSLNFSNIFRSHTRTQVTPISFEGSKQFTEAADRPETVTSLCPPESSFSPSTPPLARYLASYTETPVPPVFIKPNAAPPSPSDLATRHHHTPAPPLCLKGNQYKLRHSEMHQPHRTLLSSQCPEGKQLMLSLLESHAPSPTPCGYLTPIACSSVENSPNISPRFVVKSPVDSVFSFDSSTEEIENITMKSSNRKETTRKGWKIVLPHWCIYVAWCFVFLSSVVSAMVTFLYSMEWGKEKSIAWLTSMLLTVVESVSLIQPTKVGTNAPYIIHYTKLQSSSISTVVSTLMF